MSRRTKIRAGEPLSAPPPEMRRQTPFRLRSEAADGSGDDASGDDGSTLDGFAAAFLQETIIDSWEGKFREQIQPGAMKKTFRESPPKIQFDHGQHPMIGSIPIARLE